MATPSNKIYGPGTFSIMGGNVTIRSPSLILGNLGITNSSPTITLDEKTENTLNSGIPESLEIYNGIYFSAYKLPNIVYPQIKTPIYYDLEPNKSGLQADMIYYYNLYQQYSVQIIPLTNTQNNLNFSSEEATTVMCLENVDGMLSFSGTGNFIIIFIGDVLPLVNKNSTAKLTWIIMNNLVLKNTVVFNDGVFMGDVVSLNKNVIVQKSKIAIYCKLIILQADLTIEGNIITPFSLL